MKKTLRQYVAVINIYYFSSFAFLIAVVFSTSQHGYGELLNHKQKQGDPKDALPSFF